MTNERRKQPRHPVEFPAEVSIANRLLLGETSSLSLGGLTLITDDLLERGDTVWINLSLPRDVEAEDDEPFESSATVRWSRERADGRCVAGLQFGPLTAAQRKDLVRLLDAARPKGDGSNAS